MTPDFKEIGCALWKKWRKSTFSSLQPVMAQGQIPKSMSVAADKSYKNYKNPLEPLKSSTKVMFWVFMQLDNKVIKKIIERIVGLCGCAIRNFYSLTHICSYLTVNSFHLPQKSIMPILTTVHQCIWCDEVWRKVK